MPRSRPQILLLLVLASIGSLALGILVGYGDLSDAGMRSAYLELRAYRVTTAYFAGAALAVGGVLAQGLFRNPLASPSILGVSAGASLGAKLALLSGAAVVGGHVAFSPEMLIPLGAFVGALIALGVLMAITRNRPDIIALLLCGFLLSNLFISVGAFVTSLGQQTWELGRAMVAFMLGGVGGAGPRQALLIAAVSIVGIVGAWTWSKHLDLLLTGEEEAESLGVDTKLVKRWCVIWIALLSGAAVAVGGTIAFVGLVVPHGCRSIVGLSNRALIPASALAGGIFLVLCDLVARLVSIQGELPLGVVTGLIGAPTFLYLLLRSRYMGVLRG
ncbi:MAG: iron ABC transporter permease [Myxococcales bacterium]|nr:iron ABC transporter permease [Myxococcales bacterium]